MKLRLCLIIVFFSFKVSAQEKLKGKFEYKVTYKLNFQLDSTDNESRKSEYMYLFIGDDYSNYISRANTLSHQIIRNGNTAHTSRAALTNFHYQIVKNKNKDKLLYLLKIPKMNDQFYYDESMDLFDWQIHPETKRIKDYEVQKATTSFAGRNYVAWFSPELPIPDGPYKFNGLPGLILEIADTRNDYIFSFIGLEKLAPALTYKMNFNQYVQSTQEDIAERLHEYRRDPMTHMRAQRHNTNITISPEVHQQYIESFTKMLEKENNPIELQ